MKLEKKLNIKLDNVIINNIDIDDYVTKDEYNTKVEELNTTKEELDNTEIELSETKETLSETKEELDNTKVELDEANTKIEELKGLLIDWSQIGYTQMPQLISDGFEYAKIIVSNAPYYNDNTAFENDRQLVYFPTIDWSNVSRFNYKFANCSRLQYVGKINGNKMNPNFTYTFQNCPALHTIELLELDYAVINFTTFNGTDYLTNLTCTNLGKIFYSTVFQFGNLQYWSYNTMIDSLLNYSYDRSGETDIITIELHADAKARLTDTDIAAITLKGYTIA
jgi:hypothetical protein